MNLVEWVSRYLEADGYAVNRRGRNLVVGNRPTLGEDTEFIYVWVADASRSGSFASQEGPYLRSFAEVAGVHPRASRFLVVPTLEGLSSDFRKRALESDVQVRAPIQFFDTEFKWERSSDTASSMRELVGRAESRRRVTQPIAGSAGDGLSAIIEGLNSGQTPIQVVVGPAGAGKSVLFESLFSRLYRQFIDGKQGRQLVPRPLPLTPASVSASRERSVSGLLEAFLDSHFARPLRRETFDWMLENRLAVWLIDGLDEVIAADPLFFEEELADLVTRRVESPMVVLFVRDALVAANDSFRQFLDEYGSLCTVHRLAPWGRDQKRQFAELYLPGASDEFVRALESRTALDELASTPFYCSVLADLYAADQLGDDYSEEELVAHAVDRILKREYEKRVLEEQVLPKADVEAFIEVMAAQDLEQGLQGVPVSVALDWASLAVPDDVPPSEQDGLASRLLQLAFFSSTDGKLQFAQEVLEHYLLGRYLLGSISRQPELLPAKLDVSPIPADWITLRVVAAGLRTGSPNRTLGPILEAAAGRTPAFANAVQLAGLIPLDFSQLNAVSFENEDLTGAVFTGANLRARSFRNADLTDVKFESCDLRDAIFDDAILRNTAFVDMGPDRLGGAQFGELRRFFSIRVDGERRIDQIADASRWLAKRIGSPLESVAPCPAAQQLRFLFRKFVNPDGSARRSWLDRNGALRGKRIADPEDVLAAAARYGYLVEEPRDRIARPGGNKYSELVQYVERLELTPGLREVLADVCHVDRCEHVPDRLRTDQVAS